MFYIFLFLTFLLLLIILVAWLGSNYLTARRKPDPAASPADHGLAFEDIEFRSGDGLTLRGWYIPRPDSNRTVIICSGANGSMDADLAVAPWLHASVLNVLLFDWRGHGRSEGRLVTLGFNERYDLLAAVEFAKSKGAQRIGVLGFSMGGTVALSTAGACLDIDAVAVDSAFVHMVSAVAGAMQERHVPEQAAYLLARLFLLTASLRYGFNLFAVEPLKAIGLIAPRPVLLMYGGRDLCVPAVEVKSLYQQAGEPKQLWQIPEAAHRTLHLQQPEEYRQKIVEFFEQNLRPDRKS
jgi:fermentation-respiration switch protein FrsA (DUF1100 family)